jgi:protein-S-isoprenylcysteine O-methyltransferase Ste14
MDYNDNKEARAYARKERTMIFVFSGMTGFAFILLLDWADCKGLGALRAPCLALAALALAASAAALVASPPRLGSPPPLRLACWLLAAAFSFLLVVSLFVEVSMLGAPKGARRLRTTGTYALVRHPGAIWLLFLHLSLALATDSGPLLVAAPFWTGANLILVGLEDRIFFPRIFGAAYLEYRRAVPFVVPSRASLRDCLATFSLSRRDS